MKTNGLKHVTCHWKSYISYIKYENKWIKTCVTYHWKSYISYIKYENKWIKTCDISLEILHIIH